MKEGSYEAFSEAAQKGSVAAVVRSVPADLLTPLAAYIKLANESKYSFLLESVEGGEHLARYSFLGADPELIVIGRGTSTTVIRNDVTETHEECAIKFLRRYFSTRHLANAESMGPLAGGAVGYLGYGAAQWFDPAMQTLPSEGNDAAFMIFNTVIAFDHARQQLQIRAVADVGSIREDEVSLKLAYEDASSRIARVIDSLRRPIQWSLPDFTDADPVKFESNFSQPDFESAVLETQELIAAGECYQAVLSQRFSRKTNADAVGIYRALRVTNPSPYMYLLKCGEESLIGASPEMLVRCRGQHLEYRPIAGTRPRGSNAEEDAELARELLGDEKERAEHVMLVDLGRNDLGKVARYGTVRPERLMKVEKYSHVQHLVTELSATLREDQDRFDALGACFPAGTVTGAPKIRAMKAIADLEHGPRGVYSGSVLYADYAGNLDSCIAIRTIELRDGVASVQAGAGIVADSRPSSEYDETLNKSRALQYAVAIAEAGA
jgi:anthranilate synthase component 1